MREFSKREDRKQERRERIYANWQQQQAEPSQPPPHLREIPATRSQRSGSPARSSPYLGSLAEFPSRPTFPFECTDLPPLPGSEPPQQQPTESLPPSSALQHSSSSSNETRLKDAVTKIYGVDVTTVLVKYNSDKPAQYGAEAIVLLNKVYLAPGKENHLAHELCHIAQQQLRLVQPTMYLGETPFNDDPALEREADVRGAKAIAMAAEATSPGIVRCLQGEGEERGRLTSTLVADSNSGSKVIQAKFGMEYEFTKNKCMAKDRKDILYIGNKWKLEVDSGHNLEFVTDPLDSERDLVVALYEMIQLVNQMKTRLAYVEKSNPVSKS